MTRRLSYQWILISIGIHITLFIIMVLTPSRSLLRRNYVVFGAQSRVNHHAYFQPLIAPKSEQVARRAMTAAPAVKKTASAKQPQAKTVASKKQVSNPPKKETKPVSKPAVQAANKKQNTSVKQTSAPVKKSIQKSHEVVRQKTKKQAEQSSLADKSTVGERSLAYEQQQAARYAKHIQQVVGATWRAPLGVQKGTEMSVLFFLDGKGRVSSHKIIKKSGNMLYDMSVMQVIPQLDFGVRCAHMQLTIDFHQ